MRCRDEGADRKLRGFGGLSTRLSAFPGGSSQELGFSADRAAGFGGSDPPGLQVDSSANIAEGFAKQGASAAEFKRYLAMAIGSADEMRVWARYCLDLGYIDEASWRHWRDEYQAIARMLQALSGKWHKREKGR